jgi:hypothetical protein
MRSFRPISKYEKWNFVLARFGVHVLHCSQGPDGCDHPKKRGLSAAKTNSTIQADFHGSPSDREGILSVYLEKDHRSN